MICIDLFEYPHLHSAELRLRSADEPLKLVLRTLATAGLFAHQRVYYKRLCFSHVNGEYMCLEFNRIHRTAMLLILLKFCEYSTARAQFKRILRALQGPSSTADLLHICDPAPRLGWTLKLLCVIVIS